MVVNTLNVHKASHLLNDMTIISNDATIAPLSMSEPDFAECQDADTWYVVRAMLTEYVMPSMVMSVGWLSVVAFLME